MAITRARADQERERRGNSPRGRAGGTGEETSNARRAEIERRSGKGTKIKRRKTQRSSEISAKVLA